MAQQPAGSRRQRKLALLKRVHEERQRVAATLHQARDIEQRVHAVQRISALVQARQNQPDNLPTTGTMLSAGSAIAAAGGGAALAWWLTRSLRNK